LTPYCLAVSTIVKSVAATFTPSSLLKNLVLFLFTVNGRMARSARLSKSLDNLAYHNFSVIKTIVRSPLTYCMVA